MKSALNRISKGFRAITIQAVLFLLLSAISPAAIAFQADTAWQQYHIVFYNVQNLFDTLDNPVTDDDAFTPGGLMQWTKHRYHYKIHTLARVLDSINREAPIMMVGLCEVENRNVVKDLVNHLPFHPKPFGIIHEDSPDERGIDVALIYDTTLFKVYDYHTIRIQFPFDTLEKTRDVLFIKGRILNSDTVYVCVYHWPSRRDGVKETEPYRIYVARKIKENIEKIFNYNPDALILCMGDANDEPNDTSVLTLLTTKSATGNRLIDMIGTIMDSAKTGTFFYRGKWQFLDHFIVSSRWFDTAGTVYIPPDGVDIYNRPFLLFYDKYYHQMRCNQTYGGTRYYGGYSDHLPVLLRIHVKP